MPAHFQRLTIGLRVALYKALSVICQQQEPAIDDPMTIRSDSPRGHKEIKK